MKLYAIESSSIHLKILTPHRRRTFIRHLRISLHCYPFYTNTFGQLKELEKLGPKMKGIGRSRQVLYT
jgi:hypothetical protein